MGGIRCVASSPLGASPENHLQLAPADLLGQPLHQLGDVPVTGSRQPDVPVIALVSIESEVPEEEVGLEVANPPTRVPRDQIEVRVVHGSIAHAALPGGGIGHVDFRAVGGLVVRAAEADVENLGVGPNDVTGAVSVVRVRVHDRETREAEFLPEVHDAEGHVVEAAEAAEFVPARVMPACADESEGIGDLAGRHFSPAATTPPAECQAVEQSGSLSRAPEDQKSGPSTATAGEPVPVRTRGVGALEDFVQRPWKSASRVPIVR